MKTSYRSSVLGIAALCAFAFVLAMTVTGSADDGGQSLPMWTNPTETEECNGFGLICAVYPPPAPPPPSGAPMHCCIRPELIGSTDPNACLIPLLIPPPEC